MIKVAGMWEQGWLPTQVEYDLWRFPVREYGVDQWMMAPALDVQGSQVHQVASLNMAMAVNPELSVVVVDERGDVPLEEFSHPANALYLLGRAGRSALPLQHDHSIRIVTQEEGGRLWAHQALCLVLQDRFRKHGRDNH